MARCYARGGGASLYCWRTEPAMVAARSRAAREIPPRMQSDQRGGCPPESGGASGSAHRRRWLRWVPPGVISVGWSSGDGPAPRRDDPPNAPRSGAIRGAGWTRRALVALPFGLAVGTACTNHFNCSNATCVPACDRVTLATRLGRSGRLGAWCVLKAGPDQRVRVPSG